jgi:hypothetical protein
MKRKQATLPICLASLLLASCAQSRNNSKKPVDLDAPALEQPEPDESEPEANRDTRSSYDYDYDYNFTYTRLQLIREDIEFKDFDIDFENGSDGTLLDLERDRSSFRAEFGDVADSSFFQIFSEQVQAPSLLTEEFTNYGIGGGIIGSPVVDNSGSMDFRMPFKFEANVSFGSENVGIYSQDFGYAEGIFEVGFGVGWLGLQSSVGVIIHSIVGISDTDLPSSSALGNNSEISGNNIGGYFEVLYTHPKVPLMVRARGITGDIEGVTIKFGMAF